MKALAIGMPAMAIGIVGGTIATEKLVDATSPSMPLKLATTVTGLGMFGGAVLGVVSLATRGASPSAAAIGGISLLGSAGLGVFIGTLGA